MPNASISTKETTTAAQMHVKSNSENNLRQDTRTMASLNDDDSGSRASNNHNHNHNNNNSNSINNSNSNSNNNNNNNNNNSNTNNNNTNAEDNNSASGDAEIKLKKQTLEQRKQELERLLNEKSWLLQQIQKQETQIINGQHEYLNFNEIFANLAQQYKQEQLGGCGSSILRRKTLSTSSKENHNLNQNLNQNQHQNHVNNNNNKNNTNRQSEISNRSSEYDNYPGGSGSVDAPLEIGVGGSQYPHQHTQHAQQQQYATKSAIKKRPLPTTGAAAAATAAAAAAANLNYIQMQRQQQQQLLQRHVEQQMLQQQQQHAEQQMLQQYAQQQQQQLKLLQQPHYHQHSHQQQQADRERPFLHSPQQHQQQQRQLQLQQQQQQHGQTDAISLYSVNSANVATLRQQHVAPQQQPIIVQCDKYYLSPTHQSYNDGGFIKSSQNIKKYISPMSSPTASTAARVLHVSNNYELQQQQQQQQHVLPLQQQTLHKQQQQQQHNQRPLDVISLAPSYASIDAETAHNLRWRSQSSIPHSVSSSVSSHHPPDNKSNSSDMLAHMATMTAGGHLNYYGHPGNLKAKPLDEISISSLNSETQKKSKPKQWMESSLDGPVIRTQANNMDSTIIGQHHHHQPQQQQQHTQQQQQPHIMDAGLGTNSMRLVQQKSQACRERTKLSSQSMSSARHYSMSAHKNPHASKLLQDDEGRYAKLSQSTSYLNAMETAAGHAVSGYQLDATPLDIPNYKYLPPKPQAQALLTPPPRPPPAGTLGVAASTTTTYEKQLTIAIHSPVGGGGGGGGGSGGGGSGGGSAVATPTNQTLTGGASSLSPDIRIESPKNMTVVQQATFQPYKEVTKPFEMSDFYKYSTKFRQKEPSAHDATN